MATSIISSDFKNKQYRLLMDNISRENTLLKTLADRKITREYDAARNATLIVHLPGQRSLTKDRPGSPSVKWIVRFAVVPADLKVDSAQERALLSAAEDKGRPLTEDEVRAILLARLLAGDQDRIPLMKMEIGRWEGVRFIRPWRWMTPAELEKLYPKK
jgi:hypothetical protein